MAENNQPASGANGEGPAGIPFYEKSRQHLKELLARKRALERSLAAHEEAIYQKETDYLENTPSGNIITGFDAYTKGTTAAAAQRRRAGLTEQNRVFSRSSISYGANGGVGADGAATPGSTPASHAPTPVSTSFGNLKDKDKDHSGSGTPTSATAGGTKGGGASKKEKAGKKNAAAAAAAAAAAPVGEDSETDAKETKKVRTNFGAVRK